MNGLNEQSPRVLLVDDYPDALETWRLYFELSGVQVETASDGQMAVDVAQATHPDIIVMDLELPIISGFEATERLRHDPDLASVPIIAATGFSNFNALDQARLKMFDLVVVKPCDPATLLTQIRRLLKRPRVATASTATNGGGHHAAHSG